MFDPFGDFETRGYLRNRFCEKNRRIVQRLEHASFLVQIPEIVSTLRHEKTIRYRTLLNVHRQIFRSIYPWAGRDRSEYLCTIGKAGFVKLFAHPSDVQRASEYAIQLAPDPDNLKNKPGEVFGYFAYAHPFLDGNGRTILTVYSELCRRAGFMIRWPDIQKATFLQALTKELQDPSKGHLDALVHPYIVERKLSKRKMVDHLTDNFGREN